ncbi:MAG: formylglycine-generating enzyme family protein [Vicinamibacterales bacterium]
MPRTLSAGLAAACLTVVAASVRDAGVVRAAAQSPAPVAGVSWARLPAGTFQMGCVPGDLRCDADEGPRHAVTFTRPLDLMTTEVTIGTYRSVTQDMDDQPEWSTSPNHPVVVVTWAEAQAFCQAVGGRLPTEAEWEYAARGGRDGSIYPWGDQAPEDRAGAVNGAGFEGGGGRPVKTFAPNGFGLHDMAGNAWEWVADWSSRYGSDAATDPQGPSSGVARGVRGGSYGDDSRNLRVSNRSANTPRSVNVNIGFRCARDVPP